MFPPQIEEHGPRTVTIVEDSGKDKKEEPKPGTSKDEDISELSEPSNLQLTLKNPIFLFVFLLNRIHFSTKSGTLHPVRVGFRREFYDQLDEFPESIFQRLQIRFEGFDEGEENFEGKHRL